MTTKQCTCGQGPYFPAKVKAKVNGWERIISFMPGWVCPLKGGSSHGRHGGGLIFLLRKNNRAVHFSIATGWCPDWETGLPQLPVYPSDLGYHSPQPCYEDQLARDDCPWIEGPCYGGGSGLNAYPPFKVLLQEGEEALWTYLETYWTERFAK